MRRRYRDKRARLWWIAGIGLFIAWMIWFIRAERLILEGREDFRVLPFEARDNVALAYSWNPFRPGSLRLVCTSTGELQLVLQTLLPERGKYPRSWRNLSPQALAARLGIPGDIRAILYIDSKTGHSLSFSRARFVAIEPVDTIIAGPLSHDQVGDLVSWMDEDWRKRFGFTTLEHGVFMYGFTRGDEVRGLIARCST